MIRVPQIGLVFGVRSLHSVYSVEIMDYNCIYPPSNLMLHAQNSGSQVRFPASPSLSGETLSRGALKSEPLPVEPSGAPGHKKPPQNYKPTRPVLIKAKEHGHKQLQADLLTRKSYNG